MNNTDTKIKCPNCGNEIDIQKAMYNEMEENIKNELNRKFSEDKEKFELDIRKKYEEEKQNTLKYYEEELKRKNEEAKDLVKTKLELEKMKNEKDEIEERIKSENEIKMFQKIKEEREKTRKSEEEKNILKIKEREQIIEQLQKQLSEAQRKAEQGSMQLQGEVQELAIEEWLKSNFPLDTIEEIKKGARGGDCIQVVNSELKKNCGMIYYESKRAKDFQPAWIEKFKTDMRTKGADIGVLVTETMPRDMDHFGQKDGLWVCNFNDFKALSFVLRKTIIEIDIARSSQENKGDKLNLIYDYLTSNEFKMQIEAIVEGFSEMKSDLEKEKNAMQRLWKIREKQIEKVIINTVDMYGSIKGIAGKSIPDIKMLELPGEQ